MLRKDKNFAKFWKVVKAMIKQPLLRSAVENIQKGMYYFIE